MSRFSSIFFVAIAAIFLGGCGTLKFERSRLQGDRLQNPTLGCGMYYRIPDGYAYLNPQSPVPPKPENAKFEGYLRAITAKNDELTFKDGFREALLFRNGDRYIIVQHISGNMRVTFRRMDYRQLASVFAKATTDMSRYFGVPGEDFDYSISQVSDQIAIFFSPFRPTAAGPAGEDWRGIGYILLGDVKDTSEVIVFARATELDLARADLNAIVAGFRYGSPPSD